MDNQSIRPFKDHGYVSWINEKGEIDLQFPAFRPFSVVAEYINNHNVKKLRINSVAWQKEDLNDLKYFPNIEEISLSSSFVKDFSGLSQLPQLSALAIGDNVVTTLDLSTIPNIKSLGYCHGKQKIENWDACRALEKLSIDKFSTKNKDENPLPLLQKLSSLGLNNFNPKSSDFRCLPPFPNLAKMRIVMARIGSLNGIERFAKLEDVMFYGFSKLRNLSTIGDLPQLKKAWIENAKKIENHEVLGACKNLKNLRLINCGTINNLEGLLKNQNLKEFVFTETKIDGGDLSPLLGRKWEYLFFNDNKNYSHFLKDIIN